MKKSVNKNKKMRLFRGRDVVIIALVCALGLLVLALAPYFVSFMLWLSVMAFSPLSEGDFKSFRSDAIYAAGIEAKHKTNDSINRFGLDASSISARSFADTCYQKAGYTGFNVASYSKTCHQRQVIALITEKNQKESVAWLNERLSASGLNTYPANDTSIPDQDCYEDTILPEYGMTDGLGSYNEPLSFVITKDPLKSCSYEINQIDALRSPIGNIKTRVINSQESMDIDSIRSEASGKTVVFIIFDNKYFDESIKTR